MRKQGKPEETKGKGRKFSTGRRNGDGTNTKIERHDEREYKD